MIKTNRLLLLLLILEVMVEVVIDYVFLYMDEQKYDTTLPDTLSII